MIMALKRNFYIELHKEERNAEIERRARRGLAPKDRRAARTVASKREKPSVVDLEGVLSILGTALVVIALFVLAQVVDLWFELQRLQGEVLFNAQAHGIDLHAAIEHVLNFHV